LTDLLVGPGAFASLGRCLWDGAGGRGRDTGLLVVAQVAPRREASGLGLGRMVPRAWRTRGLARGGGPRRGRVLLGCLWFLRGRGRLHRPFRRAGTGVLGVVVR